MTDPTQTAEAYVLVVETAVAPVLVEGGDDFAITLDQPQTIVVAAGEQGPPGPPGSGGAAEWQDNDW